MKPLRRFAVVLLLLSCARAAHAQQAGVARMLGRCTAEADADACEAVLKQRINARQRSLALTYLAETTSFGRDSLLREAVALDSTNALAHYALARTLRYDRVTGMAHYAKAAALRPDWKHIPRTAAEQYGILGTAPVDTPVILWERVVAAEPTSVDARINYGKALLWKRDYAAAKTEFEKALALDADAAGVAGGLCYALLNLHEVATAQPHCTRALATREASAGGWDLRSILFAAEEAKAYDIALAAAERGMADEPMSSSYRSDRTRVLYQLNRTDEAIALLHRYIAEHPKDWGAIAETADFLFWRGDDRQARELYLRVLGGRCRSLDCMATGNLAVASLRLGLRDEAFEHFRASMKNGSCPEVLNNFRNALATQPDSALLMKRYRATLVEIGTRLENAEERDAATIAEYYTAIGDWTKAAQFYRSAIERNAEDARTPPMFVRHGLRWEYGRVLVELGRYCEGLRELNSAAAADPIYENGRPHLSAARQRAVEQCKAGAQ